MTLLFATTSSALFSSGTIGSEEKQRVAATVRQQPRSIGRQIRGRSDEFYDFKLYCSAFAITLLGKLRVLTACTQSAFLHFPFCFRIFVNCCELSRVSALRSNAEDSSAARQDLEVHAESRVHYPQG